MAGESTERFDILRSRLSTDGGRAALEYLGSLSSFRFLSVIWYSNGIGYPVYHFDKLSPDVLDADEINQQASYCAIVLRDSKPFETSNSMEDARLVNHPAREGIRSYFGLPLYAEDGDAHAVLCHYDHFPKSTSELDIDLLRHAASLFQAQLAEYGVSRRPPVVETEITEQIGNWTLQIIKRSRAEWSAPRYSIERHRRLVSGSVGPTVSYGSGTFTSRDEALQFGRDWCQASAGD
ncbi:MAG: GAF domain-containing protein [Pseudomonadota bacterium]